MKCDFPLASGTVKATTGPTAWGSHMGERTGQTGFHSSDRQQYAGSFCWDMGITSLIGKADNLITEPWETPDQLYMLLPLALTYHAFSPDSRQKTGHDWCWSKVGCWNGYRNIMSFWCQMQQWLRWNWDHSVDCKCWAHHARQPPHNFYDTSNFTVTNIMFVYSALIKETKSWMNRTDSLIPIIPPINYKFNELDLMNHNLFPWLQKFQWKYML